VEAKRFFEAVAHVWCLHYNPIAQSVTTVQSSFVFLEGESILINGQHEVLRIDSRNSQRYFSRRSLWGN
jgi:hypothetical protein